MHYMHILFHITALKKEKENHLVFLPGFEPGIACMWMQNFVHRASYFKMADLLYKIWKKYFYIFLNCEKPKNTQNWGLGQALPTSQLKYYFYMLKSCSNLFIPIYSLEKWPFYLMDSLWFMISSENTSLNVDLKD